MSGKRGRPNNASERQGDPYLYLDLNMVPKPFKRPANIKPLKKAGKSKNFRQIVNSEKVLDLPFNFPSFLTIDAPPSLLPQTKYCDITGLLAPYTYKDRGVRFHDEQIFQFLKTLDQAVVNSYLSLRNAAPKF